MMTDAFHYSTTFVLDRAHLNECYSNTVVLARPLVAYGKASTMLLAGCVVIFSTELSAYFGYFLIGLGIVEALGYHFAQPWWVARQLIGRSGNSKVTLTINEKGLRTQSTYVNSTILWSDIEAVTETNDGVLIIHNLGKSYVSTKCLSVDAKAFLMSKGE